VAAASFFDMDAAALATAVLSAGKLASAVATLAVCGVGALITTFEVLGVGDCLLEGVIATGSARGTPSVAVGAVAGGVPLGRVGCSFELVGFAAGCLGVAAALAAGVAATAAGFAAAFGAAGSGSAAVCVGVGAGAFWSAAGLATLAPVACVTLTGSVCADVAVLPGASFALGATVSTSC
jgi:hypothetical protein